MTTDELLRVAAGAGAAALVAAPYWPAIRGRLVQAGGYVRDHGNGIARMAAAALLLFAAVGNVNLALPAIKIKTESVDIETPDAAMQKIVAPVAAALKDAPAGDRMLWALTWNRAAAAVEGESSASSLAFENTKSLRDFTALALDIAWRRIGGNKASKYPDLRNAVEEAFDSTLGRNPQKTTPEILGAYQRLARALAWAGIGEG